MNQLKNEDPTFPAGLPDTEPEQDPARPLASKLPGKAKGDPRIVVRITRCGSRALDRDNLYGSAKPLIDALCRSGLIRGDGELEIDLQVQQRRPIKIPEGVGTILEIEWP